MMLVNALVAAATILHHSSAAPTTQQPLLQQPLVPSRSNTRPLQGKFLHISDLHPDPFYKLHSSVAEEDACHRGRGPAGIYGAETTDCDSPISLINATFKWIEENIKDEIDFVIWTGDSARHDNDEELPRTNKQITDLNKMVVRKFVEVFGKDDIDGDPTNDLIVPIVPTWGNNDVFPHNIFSPGPNLMTKEYLDIWRKFIPESQRHGFERGGWFSSEVIPHHLTVFSLNSIYWFDSNAAVDGCADPSEPGYEQFEWLRIQLEFVRQRGMKAIMMGHVPPARTESKMSWDETCWQKYTLWMHQFRDVVVGSLWGHMNLDHFMLQDYDEVNILDLSRARTEQMRATLDDELTIQSTADYLTELREDWANLPSPPKKKQKKKSKTRAVAKTDNASDDNTAEVEQKPRKKNKKARGSKKKHKNRGGKKGRKGKKGDYYKKIGGKWGERYSLSIVGPSVIPNYFPTLRIVEYNISGLDSTKFPQPQLSDELIMRIINGSDPLSEAEYDSLPQDLAAARRRRKGTRSKTKKKGHKKPNDQTSKRKFKMPNGPSKSAPPGPAYSQQPLSWLGYTQYYANLTRINNDRIEEEDVTPDSWKDGKHPNKPPKNLKPQPKRFEYEIEYNTRNDSIFDLEDLTVTNYIKLASRIGKFKPEKEDKLSSSFSEKMPDGESTRHGAEIKKKKSKKQKSKKQKSKKHKKKKKKHGHKHKVVNKAWYTFLSRAFVGAKDDEELHDNFGQPVKD